MEFSIKSEGAPPSLTFDPDPELDNSTLPVNHNQAIQTSFQQSIQTGQLRSKIKSSN